MALGLPLRTSTTLTLVVGELLWGRRVAQSAGTSAPRCTSRSMSLCWFIVITSASRPSATLRAWRLLPPWLWFSVTVWPEVFFQWAANATLKSL